MLTVSCCAVAMGIFFVRTIGESVSELVTEYPSKELSAGWQAHAPDPVACGRQSAAEWGLSDAFWQDVAHGIPFRCLPHPSGWESYPS